jgi:ribosomal protein S30
MRKKKTPKVKPKDKKAKPSRTEQARKVAEEYASDQREVIKKLPKPLN